MEDLVTIYAEELAPLVDEALSHIFEEEITDIFLVCFPERPTFFNLSFYVKTNEKLKQEFTFTRPRPGQEKYNLLAKVYNIIEALSQSILTYTKKVCIEADAPVIQGLKIYYSPSENYVFWEPIYEKKQAITANSWAKNLIR